MDKGSSPGSLVPSRVSERFKPILARWAGLALGLWGEAGIGKSYTARELLQQTPCRSFSLHATVSLPALVQQLGEPPHTAPFPLWAQTLLERLGCGEPLGSEKAASALSALLAALAPVILHLEDLHEAPAERLELVRELARMVSRTRGTALLVTSRVLPPEPFQALRIEPLSFETSRSLLEAELRSGLPKEAVTWIYEQAQGNPLFTLEYLRHLARQGFLWNDGSCWHWRAPLKGETPLTVEALIEQALKEAARGGLEAIIAAKAVLPLGVEEAFWAQVAGVSPETLEREKGRLEAAGVLRNGEFVHPLYREVSLHLLPPPHRQELARRALEALQPHDPEGAAAYIEEAGLEREEALELLGRAAEHARQAGNEVQAARWGARAAGYARGEEQGRMALEAAQVLQHHDLPEAARLVRLALPTPAATAETVRFYAHLLARQGHPPDLEALLEGLPPKLREAVDLPSLAVTTYNIAGNNAKALEVWLAHPRLHADPSPDLLRAAAASALATGQMEMAESLTARGIATADPALRCEFLSIQALTHYHRGEYAAAEATLAQALEILGTLDAPRLRGTVLVNRAAFLRMLGRYDEMGRCLEEALQIRRQAGDAKAYAFALAALAELLVEQGRYGAAEEAVLEAIATLELYGPSRFLANAHSIASLLYRSQDTPIARLLALKHADLALGYARQLGSPRVVRELLFDASLASTGAGQPERGLALAAEAEGLAGAAGDSPHDNFRTRWAKGLALEALGERGAAVQALREALEGAGQLDVAIDEHKLGLELDRLTGDVESARRRLGWFEGHGLTNGANLARRYFPQLAEAAPETPPAALRLELLGSMQFAGAPVRGHKRQELLALLLEARVAGRGEVGRLELLDALYPSEDEERAASALKELIHSVRSRWGASVVVTTPTGYALGATVGSDLEEFLRTGDTRLWRGAYLEGLASFNETVRESAHLALRARAGALLEADPKEAARLGRLLLEADPYDLEALRLTLEALRRTGNHRSLNRLYEEARARVLEVGEALPERWPDFLTPA
ncbi:AAA family ATPase [Meiothermus rufus]|uniref:AAA family ATPase n=1 Tax=Meiothermus rufus TaxID=604332 RepID=UPI0003FBAD70|nr:AAA family ATPase [Meiothermus rufus]